MAVVMLYPDKRFVEQDPEGKGHPTFLDLHEIFWTETIRIGITQEIFRKRVGLINTLLDVYRNEGHQVYWTLFSQAKNPGAADREHMHPLYTIRSKDLVFPCGVSYYTHTRNAVYPDEKKLLSTLDLGSEVICGGFHSGDCVARFSNAARELGKRSSIDYLLTERWFFKVIDSFQEDINLYRIKYGFLDPVMHEDDPCEEKYLLFDGRLSREDVALELA